MPIPLLLLAVPAAMLLLKGKGAAVPAPALPALPEETPPEASIMTPFPVEPPKEAVEEAAAPSGGGGGTYVSYQPATTSYPAGTPESALPPPPSGYAWDRAYNPGTRSASGPWVLRPSAPSDGGTYVSYQPATAEAPAKTVVAKRKKEKKRPPGPPAWGRKFKKPPKPPKALLKRHGGFGGLGQEVSFKGWGLYIVLGILVYGAVKLIPELVKRKEDRE